MFSLVRQLKQTAMKEGLWYQTYITIAALNVHNRFGRFGFAHGAMHFVTGIFSHFYCNDAPDFEMLHQAQLLFSKNREKTPI